MRLEVGKQASRRPVAPSGTDVDGLVHTMNEARDRPQIIIRSLEVHDPCWCQPRFTPGT